jgi:hypothetical protein
VNFTTLSELPEGAPIMTGTFSINHQPVIILFDSGATHSFISPKCGTKMGLDIYPANGAYMKQLLAVKFHQIKSIERFQSSWVAI